MFDNHSVFCGTHTAHMHGHGHLHAVSAVGVMGVVGVVVVNVAFLFENKSDKTIDRCMNNNNNRKAGGKMFSLRFLTKI